MWSTRKKWRIRVPNFTHRLLVAKNANRTAPAHHAVLVDERRSDARFQER